ncbi:hypothetical protein BDV96DRAFT_654718 [Lophiotrema nucula]|uniref:Nephrocystin 3-like N-terminal domain-containing protein n=1 Tax=Lophiotrema nucula TaxID=690887 RepID=A0A6A5YGC3_9PLEO|nr:hypothetical protein BDV96DRAFT_654718 [Lophiotrema nucula]
MAEALGIVSGSLTVLELTVKVFKQCKHLIETTQDAPRDLKHIFIEISSLKAVLESFDTLSQGSLHDKSVVEGCRSTVDEISQELEGLSITHGLSVGSGKRQRIKGALKWTMKEEKVRKLLDETILHKSTITLAMLGDITNDIKDIKGTMQNVQDQLTVTDQRKVCDWIEHTNPTMMHNQSCRYHEDLTCRWMHRIDQWNDWLSRRRRVIWIHGIPGAGKTVLTSYLIQKTIEHCESLQAERSACIYYYCSFRHGNRLRQDECEPFLRWIVSQLCRISNTIPSDLIELHQQNSIPGCSALKSAFKELLSGFDALFIILDAADESFPRQDLLRLLEEIATHPDFQNIQLLVTSRRYPDIERMLRPLSEPSLPMSNSVVETDIRIYTSAMLERQDRFKRWPKDLKEDILEKLVHGAQGMFRWVVCQIHRLLRKTPTQARKVLEDLPETLDDTYERIFEEIPRDDRAIARSALRWICGHADLPFYHGIPAYCLLSATFGTGASLNPDSISDSYEFEHLHDILGCLIQVELVGESVRHNDSNEYRFHAVALAHYTVQEFLLSDRIQRGSASYFALRKDDCARDMLVAVLEQQSHFSEDTLRTAFFRDYRRYCYDVARFAPVSWESFLQREQEMWHRLRSLFDTNIFTSNGQYKARTLTNNDIDYVAELKLSTCSQRLRVLFATSTGSCYLPSNSD